MSEDRKVKLDIPFSTVLKVTISIAVLVLLFRIKEVFILLFVVGILVAAFRPIVQRWERHIGRPIAILSLLVLTLLAIGGFIYIIIPPLVEQVGQLINNMPDYIDRYANLKTHFPTIEKGISSLTQNLGDITGSFLSFTASFFGAVVTFFTVLILTFYFLADEKSFSRAIIPLIPQEKKILASDVLNKLAQKVGDWLRGQLFLGLIIGLITFIGLTIIGIPYALTLAIIAGVFEFIPIVGPVISGVLAVLSALTISPILAIITTVFFVILQQLENNLLVPKVMQKAVGLPPAIIIIAVLIGGKLLGISGALLAVPVCAVLFVVVQEWSTLKKLANP
ncbi:MAG TPA: AI-2E family transporter [bacterium]|nr:AI-2E family transporter [bacterium]